jgi:hypothetical protein
MVKIVVILVALFVVPAVILLGATYRGFACIPGLILMGVVVYLGLVRR